MRSIDKLRCLLTWKAYAMVSTAVISGFVVAACNRTSAQPQTQKFDEIDVQRINVREPDGTLRLVISNHAKLPDVIFKGKEYVGARGGDPGPGRYAGMIFFNSEGTEQGGLGFGGVATPDGHRAGGILAFDQYNQDETVGIAYRDVNGTRSAGLVVQDQPSTSIEPWLERSAAIRKLPDGPEKKRQMAQLIKESRESGETSAQRLFVGRDENKASLVDLRDGGGKTRLRLRVDSTGTARIEFLDTAGNVTYSIGPDGKASPGSL